MTTPHTATVAMTMASDPTAFILSPKAFLPVRIRKFLPSLLAHFAAEVTML